LSQDYWRFWLAASVSNLGDGLRLVALPLLALRITTDPLLIAGVTALNFAPWVLVGPISGAIVDRVNRKRLLIGVQLVRSVVVAAFAVSVAMDAVSIASLYAVAVVIAVGETLADSAAQAAVPYLAEPHQLERANGRMVSAEIVTNEVAGGPLGGLLFAAVAFLPFAADAVSYLAAVLLVALVRTDLGPGSAPADLPVTRLHHDVVEGLRFVFTHPLLQPLTIATALVNVGGGAVNAILVLYAVETIGLSEVGFGLMLGLGAIGGLGGALVASRVVALAGRHVTIVGTAVVIALASLWLAVTNGPAMLATTWFVISAATATSNVVTRSLRQAATPDRLLGRMVTSIRLVGLGAIPIGAVAGGLLARQFGIRTPFVFGAAAIAAAAIVLGTLLDRDAMRAADPAVPADAARGRTASH
jgi:MFS family permease